MPAKVKVTLLLWICAAGLTGIVVVANEFAAPAPDAMISAAEPIHP